MDLVSHLNRASLVNIKATIIELLEKPKRSTVIRNFHTDQLKMPVISIDSDCEIPLEVFLKAALQELLKVSTYISKSEIQLDPVTNRYFLRPSCAISEETLCNKDKDKDKAGKGQGGNLYGRLSKLLKKLCVLWELSDIDSYGRLRWDSFSNFCLRMGRSYFKASINQTNLRFVLIHKGHATIPNYQYHYIPSLNMLVSNDHDSPTIRLYRKFGKRILLVESWNLLDRFITAINPRTIQQEALNATKSKQAAFMIMKNSKRNDDWRPPERVRIISMCVIDEHSCIYLSMSSSHIVRLVYKKPTTKKEEQESDGDSDFSDGDDDDVPDVNHTNTFDLTEQIQTKQIQTGLIFSKKLNMLISWSGYSGDNAFRLWDGVAGLSDGDSKISLDNGVSNIRTSSLTECFEVHLHSNVIVSVCEVVQDHWHFLASCSADNDVLLWSINFEKSNTSSSRFISGVNKYKLEGHKRGIKNLVYAPQYQLLVGAGYDSVVYMWDPSSKHLIHQLCGHIGTIDGLTIAYFPTEHLISVDENRTIKVWRLRKGFEGRCDEVASIPLDSDREGGASNTTDGKTKKKELGANPNGKTAASEEKDGSNLKHAVQLDRYHVHGLITAFERGRYFAVRSDELYVFMFKGSLSKDIRPVRNGLTIISDSRKIISLSQRMVYLFDLDTGRSLKQVHFLDNEISDVPSNAQKEIEERENNALAQQNENKKSKSNNNHNLPRSHPTAASSVAVNASASSSSNVAKGTSSSSSSRPKSAGAASSYGAVSRSNNNSINNSNNNNNSSNNEKFNPFLTLVKPKAKTLVPPTSFDESDSIKSVTFDESMKKMFLGTNSGVVHVFDTSSLSLVKTLRMPRKQASFSTDLIVEERGFVVSLKYINRDGLLIVVFSSGAVGVFSGCVSQGFKEDESKSSSEAKYLHMRPEPPDGFTLLRSADYSLVNDNSVSLAAVSLVASMIAVAVGETSSVVDASRIYFYDYCSLLMLFVVRLPLASEFTLMQKEASKINPGVKLDDLVPDSNDNNEATLVYATDMAFASDLPLLVVADSVGRITLYRTCVDNLASSSSSSLDIYRILTWKPWQSSIINPPRSIGHHSINIVFAAASIISLKLVFIPESVERLTSQVDANVSVNITSSITSTEKELEKNIRIGSNSNSNSNKNSSYSATGHSIPQSTSLSSGKHPTTITPSAAIAASSSMKDKAATADRYLTPQEFSSKLSGVTNGRWCVLYSNDAGNIVVQDVTTLVLKEESLIEFKTEDLLVFDSGSNIHSRYRLTMHTNKFLSSENYYTRLRNLAAYRYGIHKRQSKLDGLIQFPDRMRRLEQLLESPFGWKDINIESAGPNKQLRNDVITINFAALANLKRGNVVNVVPHIESGVLIISFDDGVIQVRRLSDLEVIGQCEDANASLKTLVQSSSSSSPDQRPWDVNIKGNKSRLDHHTLITEAVRYINSSAADSSDSSSDSSENNSLNGLDYLAAATREGAEDDEEKQELDSLFTMSIGSSITGPKSLHFGHIDQSGCGGDFVTKEGETSCVNNNNNNNNNNNRNSMYIKGAIEGPLKEVEEETEPLDELDLENVTFEKQFEVNTDYLVWKEVLIDEEFEKKRIMQKKLEARVKMTVKGLNATKGDVLNQFKKAQQNTPLVGLKDKAKVDKIQGKFNRIFENIHRRVLEREMNKKKFAQDDPGGIKSMWSHNNISKGNERKISAMLDFSNINLNLNLNSSSNPNLNELSSGGGGKSPYGLQKRVSQLSLSIPSSPFSGGNVNTLQSPSQQQGFSGGSFLQPSQHQSSSSSSRSVGGQPCPPSTTATANSASSFVDKMRALHASQKPQEVGLPLGVATNKGVTITDSKPATLPATASSSLVRIDEYQIAPNSLLRSSHPTPVTGYSSSTNGSPSNSPVRGGGRGGEGVGVAGAGSAGKPPAIQIPSYTVYSSQSSINLNQDEGQGQVETRLANGVGAGVGAGVGLGSSSGGSGSIPKRPGSAPLLRNKTSSSSSSTSTSSLVPFSSQQVSPHISTIAVAPPFAATSATSATTAASPSLHFMDPNTKHYMLPKQQQQQHQPSPAAPIDHSKLKQMSDRFDSALKIEEDLTTRVVKKVVVVSQYAQSKKSGEKDDAVLVKNKAVVNVSDTSHIKVEELGPYRHKEIISVTGMLLELLGDELKRRDFSSARAEKTLAEYKTMACDTLLIEDSRINLSVIVRNSTIIKTGIAERAAKKAAGVDTEGNGGGGGGGGGLAATNNQDGVASDGTINIRPLSPSLRPGGTTNQSGGSNVSSMDEMYISEKIATYCKKSFDNCISIQEMLNIFFGHSTVAVMNRIIRVMRLTLMLEDMLSSAVVKEYEGVFVDASKKGKNITVSLKNVASVMKAKAKGASPNSKFILTQLPGLSHGFEGWSVSHTKVGRLQGFLEIWCSMSDGGLRISDLILCIQALIPSSYLVNCRPVLQMASLIRDRLKMKTKTELNSEALLIIFGKILKLTISE